MEKRPSHWEQGLGSRPPVIWGAWHLVAGSVRRAGCSSRASGAPALGLRVEAAAGGSGAGRRGPAEGTSVRPA